MVDRALAEDRVGTRRNINEGICFERLAAGGVINKAFSALV
jgi:hypothetical protein